MVDHRRIHPGRPGHLPQACPFEAVFGEEPPCDLEDVVPGLSGTATPPPPGHAGIVQGHEVRRRNVRAASTRTPNAMAAMVPASCHSRPVGSE